MVADLSTGSIISNLEALDDSIHTLTFVWEVSQPPVAQYQDLKIKVCWHHDDLHMEGKLYLPEGVWKDTLSPAGSAEITLAGIGVTNQTLYFEIKGKKEEKWEYKDKKNDYGNIKEFKIDWKEKAPKFDYKGDLQLL